MVKNKIINKENIQLKCGFLQLKEIHVSGNTITNDDFIKYTIKYYDVNNNLNETQPLYLSAINREEFNILVNKLVMIEETVAENEQMEALSNIFVVVAYEIGYDTLTHIKAFYFEDLESKLINI